MAKEWILNSVMNRFQLNLKRNVGAVSEEIRKRSPKNLQEWESYYFENVRDKDHIVELGKRLYVKITEVVKAEIDLIDEEECINYMLNLVINRTYDGYTTEIKTVYEQLEKILKVSIEPASDEWDRKYNVDFFIEIGNKFIGIQIKPLSGVSHIPQMYKERNLQEKSHLKFTNEFGGKVFYIHSVKEGRKKKIQNLEIINEIEKEIERLKSDDR